MNTLDREAIYESRTVSAKLDPAGWLEFTVAEGEIVTYKDLEAVARALLAHGKSSIRVLVVRTTSYSTGADVITSDLRSVAGLAVEKVAYFAPNVSARLAAELESRTALRHLPSRQFDDREEALAWLLSNEEG
jgi:hypothetical protein